MPSVYDLKPRFQALLRPILKQLVAVGITPNLITLSALMLSAVGGAVLFLAPQHAMCFLVMPLVLFLRMALNALDGMMAREYDMKSSLGEILNELGDVVSDLLLYLPLTVVIPFALQTFSFEWLLLWSAFLILTILSEFCGVLGKAMVGERFYQGPMGKSDRAFWIGVLAILMAGHWMLMICMNGMALLMVVLLVLTCFNRLKAILKSSKSEGK